MVLRSSTLVLLLALAAPARANDAGLMGLRRLSWPGKVETSTLRPAVLAAAPTRAEVPTPYKAPVASPARQDPPQRAEPARPNPQPVSTVLVRPVPPSRPAAETRQGTAAETAAFAAPPTLAPPPARAAVPTPPAQAASTQPASTLRPRTYSLHREYGERPDAVSLPAPAMVELVGPSDLAEPPQPPAPRDARRDRNLGDPTPSSLGRSQP